MDEHRAIEHGLALLEAFAEQVERGEHVPAERVERLLDFFRHFADHCHHAKEEGVLFPALEARGIRREGGPIGVMLFEHETGRSLIRHMREALKRMDADPTARDRFAASAGSYLVLLKHHIAKEDNVLFHMAQAVLTDEDDDRLVEEFDRHEHEVIGAGEHARLHALLEELEHELVAQPVN